MRETRASFTQVYLSLRGKRLDWIYCHVFVPEVPPRECWAFDETTYPIKIVGVSGDDPLPKKALVLPDSVPLEERPHWYHDGTERKAQREDSNSQEREPFPPFPSSPAR